MPLPAVVVVAASALGGALLFSAYEKTQQKKVAEDAAKQSAFQNVARELQKGRSYTVQMMVDPRHPQWGGVRDLATASNLIRATFEQLGWKFLMHPKPREDQQVAAAKLASGQPLEWVFNGTWTRDEKYQPMSPGWVGMALPYLLPTS